MMFSPPHHSLGADHELPLELDKSAVGLERGEGLGRGEEEVVVVYCLKYSKGEGLGRGEGRH